MARLLTSPVCQLAQSAQRPWHYPPAPLPRGEKESHGSGRREIFTELDTDLNSSWENEIFQIWIWSCFEHSHSVQFCNNTKIPSKNPEIKQSDKSNWGFTVFRCLASVCSQQFISPISTYNALRRIHLFSSTGFVWILVLDQSKLP